MVFAGLPHQTESTMPRSKYNENFQRFTCERTFAWIDKFRALRFALSSTHLLDSQLCYNDASGAGDL